MARLPRLTLPGHPHHVIQRGNNRQPVFAGEEDYRQLLSLLESHASELKVAVHAYVLMPNHFHLLATPETDRGLPELMQAVGRRYVRYFNAKQGRTGTLWEGRYRSTLLQADRYLLPCMAYLDLNPVRGGLAAEPAGYPWSSHRHYTGIGNDRLVTPHPAFWALGDTPFAREQAYAQLVTAGLGEEMQQALTNATHRGWALGDQRYLDELERLGARRTAPKPAGRPRKAVAN
ncbi:transposase [Ramlibacter humi]|uniref:Transposase n=1 Tax=Ramlibacter humi TaxID=2530451 RepID=A0A4Z0BL48_9BURK|nr:transposase [Ramlibacter humi]TFY98987.1 transposase [Ramlibacter humi]